MKKIVYMAVTADKYELPLYVTENLDEMADKFHKTKGCILSSISHQRKGKKGGIMFLRIEEENDD